MAIKNKLAVDQKRVSMRRIIPLCLMLLLSCWGTTVLAQQKGSAKQSPITPVSNTDQSTIQFNISMENIRYVDTNNNSYSVREGTLRYSPITPENSSSGTYSGGEPKSKTLTDEEMAGIQQKVQEIEDTPSLHLQQRQMLTAMLFVGEQDNRRKYILGRSEKRTALEQLLKEILAE